jgi:septum site-determining protein MinD
VKETAALTEIIVVTSGKGGVGKTTTSASLACGLARRGKKVAVIDFDIGLRNLDLILGCERRVVYDFVNVIQGDAKLAQALVRDKHTENLSILAASQTKDKDSLTEEGVKAVLDELQEMGFEYIICDSPAGIESGALMALRFADEALVVTNPEVSAVRDADRMLGLIGARSLRAEQGRERVKEHLVITRYAPLRADKGEMLAHTDVAELLSLPILGLIPESEQVLDCSNQGVPVILANGSPVALAYDDMVARFLGEERPLRFIQLESPPLWKRLFGGSRVAH